MFVRHPCIAVVPYAKRSSAPSVESLRVTGWLRYAPIARAARRRARGRDLTAAGPPGDTTSAANDLRVLTGARRARGGRDARDARGRYNGRERTRIDGHRRRSVDAPSVNGLDARAASRSGDRDARALAEASSWSSADVGLLE